MDKHQAAKARLWNYMGGIGSMLVAAVALRVVFDFDNEPLPLETGVLLLVSFLLIIIGSFRGKN